MFAARAGLRLDSDSTRLNAQRTQTHRSTDSFAILHADPLHLATCTHCSSPSLFPQIAMRRKSRAIIPTPELPLPSEMRQALNTALTDRRYTGPFTTAHTLKRWVNPGLRIYSKASEEVKSALVAKGSEEVKSASVATETSSHSRSFDLKLPLALHDLSPDDLYLIRSTAIAKELEVTNPEWHVDVCRTEPAPALFHSNSTL